MYAHQVIEDLFTKRGMIKRESGFSLESIKNYIQFHLNFESLHEVAIKNKKTPFLKKEFELPEQFLPYRECWFDFEMNSFGILKAGALIKQLSDNEYRVLYFCVPQENATKGAWMVMPINSWWHPQGQDFPWKKDVRIVKEFFPVAIDSTSKNFQKVLVDTSHFVDMTLNIAFLLLNCRNIETVDNPPPEKLNKKRQKKGKQPLFTYKTLVIKPTGKQQKSIPKHLWDNRVHLCRGHFKTYTEDAPLFGKYTGRYWWQPSVRGRNKKGVVMKDYEVRTESVSSGENGN